MKQFEYCLTCCGDDISKNDADIIRRTHCISKSNEFNNKRFLKLLSQYVSIDGKCIDFKSRYELDCFISICESFL